MINSHIKQKIIADEKRRLSSALSPLLNDPGRLEYAKELAFDTDLSSRDIADLVGSLQARTSKPNSLFLEAMSYVGNPDIDSAASEPLTDDARDRLRAAHAVSLIQGNKT